MKKWMQGRFRIPEEGKVTETVLFSRIGIAAAMIMLCMAAMSFTAYAYFSCSVTSGMNKLQAANYELDIEIVKKGDPQTEGQELTGNETTLSEGTYTITMSYRHTETAASTGFCVVKMGNVTYRTAQIGADQSVEDSQWRESVSFTLVITGEGSLDIEFVPHWGTSSHYTVNSLSADEDDDYITDGETVAITVGSAAEETPADTEPETTTLPTETTAQPAETDPPALEDGMYTVRSGDTLSKIAKLYGTSVDELTAYNNLDPEKYIYAGQKIGIPPEDWEIPAEEEETT